MGYHSEGFAWDNELQEQAETERTTYRKRALFTLAGGIAIATVGLLGLDRIEAKTPEEAYMSTEILGRELFLSKDELPFAVATAIGIVAMSAGGASLIHGKDEK